jgi:hypothetical protein
LLTFDAFSPDAGCAAPTIQDVTSVTEKGQTMKDKRTYEKPELQRLGLLRDLTKLTWSFTPPQHNNY